MKIVLSVALSNRLSLRAQVIALRAKKPGVCKFNVLCRVCVKAQSQGQVDDILSGPNDWLDSVAVSKLENYSILSSN
jgi:hypothetical protein